MEWSRLERLQALAVADESTNSQGSSGASDALSTHFSSCWLRQSSGGYSSGYDSSDEEGSESGYVSGGSYGMPPSPTIRTRRLSHSPESDLPSPLHLPDSPFACVRKKSLDAHTLASHDDLSAPNEVDHEAEVIPFAPVLPFLQQQHTAADSPSVTQLLLSPLLQGRQLSQSRATSARRHASLAQARSHLLQLACASPSSSAASSSPSSPDLHSTHAPHSPQLEPLALYTPDSPSWVSLGSAHQSHMELSLRRRAREMIHGRESVARMRLRGLSSRAQQSLQGEDADSPFDSPYSSDYETPSPLPNSARVRPIGDRPLHRIKPLMPSHGHLHMTAMLHSSFGHAASSTPPSPSMTPAESSIVAGVMHVEPQLLIDFLAPLDDAERRATLRPIAAQLHAATNQAATAGDTGDFALSSIPSLPPTALSLLLSRCISRSQWRASLPFDLAVCVFSFLDLSTLLLVTTRLSKWWGRAVRACIAANSSSSSGPSPDVAAPDRAWQQEIAARREQIKRKQRLRTYRRLTLERQPEGMG